MKISKIKIENFRLLKNFSIDLEDLLSLVIGKNNCGKTSLLALLERFLGGTDSAKFQFDDLNIESQLFIKEKIDEAGYELDKNFGINLKLYISYDEKDSLANISSLMLDLNPDIKTVVLSFEYALDPEYFNKLKVDFSEFKRQMIIDLEKKFKEEEIPAEKQKIIKEDSAKKKDLLYFLKKYHADYFKLRIKALEFSNETNFIDLIQEKISLDKILSFKRIKAKRDVANDEYGRRPDKTLSKMSSKYYDKISNADVEADSIKKLQDELSDTDDKLNKVYDTLFANVIEKVKKFGGVKKDESMLMIVSSLEEKSLLTNNTTVMYKHSQDNSLPEDYNGLGYMNLIAIIFEIEVLINDFKKKKLKEETPADINLLFIEEPEAHTHPQMQYVFIKNIKTILEDAFKGTDDGIAFNLQTIITTHSSCITAESDFDDIKYFHRSDVNQVIAKNLKDLQREYTEEDPNDYKFLKQYLTLNRAELFFADKAIFIEGDTERLLLPAMMKKLDTENKDDDIALLSQNISVIEVGAYSQIFEKFIDFLGIKTLVITDLDTCRKVKTVGKDGVIKKNKKGEEIEHNEKCPVAIGESSTNTALAFFFKGKDLDFLKTAPLNSRCFSKTNVSGTKSWNVDEHGKLCFSYQSEENSYSARSFEDAFIHLNLEFIKNKRAEFKGLKNLSDFDDTSNAFDLAENCIDKKTLFALDILFQSDTNFSNWLIPSYIKEGLLWLKK